ncbi:MAG TPA: ABC transporter permease [Firmicutes bacterium]|nr:ABC transporter permease [Bacillota bacterium]
MCRFGLVESLYLPAPSAILVEFTRMLLSGELLMSIWLSLKRIIWGFLLGCGMGILVGLAVGLSPVMEALIDPLLSLTYPIPKIALLPLIILWLGIGESSKVAIIAVGAFYPVCINTIAGVKGADPLLISAARSLGANRLQVIQKVVLMSALPVILAGIRLAAGMSLLLVVSAEMVAATAGIGYLILYAGDLMLTTKLMAGILVLCVLGLGSTLVLQRIERALVPWSRGR